MEQIRYGLEDELNVSIYANFNLSTEEMYSIYEYLLARKEAGLND